MNVSQETSNLMQLEERLNRKLELRIIFLIEDIHNTKKHVHRRGGKKGYQGSERTIDDIT